MLKRASNLKSISVGNNGVRVGNDATVANKSRSNGNPINSVANNTTESNGGISSVPLKTVENAEKGNVSVSVKSASTASVSPQPKMVRDIIIENGVLIKAPSDCVEYTVPASVTKIGDNAFANNTVLKSVIVPVTLKEIGNSAFENCTALEDIKIPSQVKSIGSRAFANCKSLTFIVVPNTVKAIDANTFSGCKALDELYLPDNIVLLQ